MILNVCFTDTPGTATFHQVRLEDKKMNSIIFRKMPDVVIICHALLSEMFFNNGINVWYYVDVVQITRCQPSYPQQTSLYLCVCLDMKVILKKREVEIGTC